MQWCSIVGNLHRTGGTCSGPLPTMRLRKEVWRSSLLWNASYTWTPAELTPPSATGVCLWSRLVTGDAVYLIRRRRTSTRHGWTTAPPCVLSRVPTVLCGNACPTRARSAIADVSDVTHECAYSGKTPSPGQWLYPCAMQVPGTQHFLYTILKDSVERLCWWHAWERDAKVVCQRLHKKLHRDFF